MTCSGSVSASQWQTVSEINEAWQERRAMVREQIERRGVKDPAVLAAMRTVPRHLFVAEQFRSRAYFDRPLPIGQDSDPAPAWR